MIQIYDLRTVDSLKNAKDLDLPKFWPLGVSRDQKFKMKNSEHRFSSKNNVSKYGPETEKHHSENELKIIHYVQIWPPDVKNLKKSRKQIWQAEKLSTWLLSSGLEFDEKLLDSKPDLKVSFKPSRKIKDFVFLKFGHSEKATKIWNVIWHLLSKRQIMWENVSNFVAFLENLNFTSY